MPWLLWVDEPKFVLFHDGLPVARRPLEAQGRGVERPVATQGDAQTIAPQGRKVDAGGAAVKVQEGLHPHLSNVDALERQQAGIAADVEVAVEVEGVVDLRRAGDAVTAGGSTGAAHEQVLEQDPVDPIVEARPDTVKVDVTAQLAVGDGDVAADLLEPNREPVISREAAGAYAAVANLDGRGARYQVHVCAAVFDLIAAGGHAVDDQLAVDPVLLGAEENRWPGGIDDLGARDPAAHDVFADFQGSFDLAPERDPVGDRLPLRELERHQTVVAAEMDGVVVVRGRDLRGAHVGVVPDPQTDPEVVSELAAMDFEALLAVVRGEHQAILSGCGLAAGVVRAPQWIRASIAGRRGAPVGDALEAGITDLRTIGIWAGSLPVTIAIEDDVAEDGRLIGPGLAAERQDVAPASRVPVFAGRQAREPQGRPGPGLGPAPVMDAVLARQAGDGPDPRRVAPDPAVLARAVAEVDRVARARGVDRVLQHLGVVGADLLDGEDLFRRSLEGKTGEQRQHQQASGHGVHPGLLYFGWRHRHA